MQASPQFVVPAAEAMPGIIADVEYNGIAHIDSWNQLYVDAQASGAKLIGSQAHQIAFQKITYIKPRPERRP